MSKPPFSAVGTGLPKAGYGGVDQRRVGLFQAGVVDAKFGCDPRAEVLDNDLAPRGKPLHYLPATWILQVGRQALLAAIQSSKAIGLALDLGIEVSGGVAFKAFHLDYVGTEVTEYGRAVGSRQDIGEIENADTFER